MKKLYTIIQVTKCKYYSYLVVISNNTFREANTFASAEDVLSNIINVELKHKFSLEEITDIKSYSKIDEKTNAEVFAK